MKSPAIYPGAAIVLVSLSMLLLSSCSTTETGSVAPHINVSPEDVILLESVESTAALDLGLDLEANESDSLDNLEVLPGVRVASVNPSGPAAASGLKPGDVILSLNGTKTDDPDALLALARSAKPGATLRFETRRDTVVFEASLIPRTLPEGAPPPRELYRVDPVKSRAGFRTVVLKEGEAKRPAARVVEIFPESPLPAAGLHAGDVLIALDETKLTSAQDLVRRLLEDYEPGDRVTLTAVQDGRQQEFELDLWHPGTRLARLAVLPLFNYESKLEPSSTAFSFIDLWLFSLFSYKRLEGEREYRIFSLIRFATGYGELIEEDSQEEDGQ